MGWATTHIERLQAGETVQFRPRGTSMQPRIMDRALVTVEPATTAEEDDVVLCRVRGRDYLHRVEAVGDRGFRIGNMQGHTNGWTRSIFGKVVEVAP